MSEMSTKEAPRFEIEDNIIKGRKFHLPEDKRLNEIILANLKENPDFVGQIDAQTGETCTYKKLADDSIRCALWLKKQGIGPGDIVSICSHNSIASWSSFCAIMFAGANSNLWYPDCSPVMARHFANMTKPKIIFANEQAGSMLREVVKQEGVKSKIVVFGQIPGLDSFDDIIKEASAEKVEKFQCHPVKPDDNALLLFSSGSTGLPKGVQHSYLGVYYNIFRFNITFKEYENAPLMFSSSLSWITGSLCALRNLLTNCPAIIINNPTPEEVLKTVEKFKIQWLFMGTGLTNALFKSEHLDKHDLSSIKVIVTGGEKVRAEVTKKFNILLKNGEILQGYGPTELGGLAILQEKGHSNHDSCGIVLLDVEMKIIDPVTKETLGPNQKGEMLFKQKYMMKYYFLNPRATQETVDKDGWLHTGDLGYYDEEGYVYILDRIKGMIKYRDHHVSPFEIENILLKNPKVLEAAVVPVPHSVDAEHPLAFVSKIENAEVSSEELLNMTSCLDDTKKLRGGIIFLEKLPKTPTGKIDRSKLKEMAETYAK